MKSILYLKHDIDQVKRNLSKNFPVIKQTFKHYLNLPIYSNLITCE